MRSFVFASALGVLCSVGTGTVTTCETHVATENPSYTRTIIRTPPRPAPAPAPEPPAPAPAA
jgi:hypothetical protein